jgi:hypothetical protein
MTEKNTETGKEKFFAYTLLTQKFLSEQKKHGIQEIKQREPEPANTTYCPNRRRKDGR